MLNLLHNLAMIKSPGLMLASFMLTLLFKFEKKLTECCGSSVVDAGAVTVTAAVVGDALLRLCNASKTALSIFPAKSLDILAGNIRVR